jgi:hypothetical protein
MRKSAESVAMNAITSLGESAIQLKYARRALGCYSLQSLARETVATTAEFGLKGHVQFRTPARPSPSPKTAPPRPSKSRCSTRCSAWAASSASRTGWS